MAKVTSIPFPNQADVDPLIEAWVEDPQWEVNNADPTVVDGKMVFQNTLPEGQISLSSIISHKLTKHIMMRHHEFAATYGTSQITGLFGADNELVMSPGIMCRAEEVARKVALLPVRTEVSVFRYRSELEVEFSNGTPDESGAFNFRGSPKAESDTFTITENGLRLAFDGAYNPIFMEGSSEAEVGASALHDVIDLEYRPENQGSIMRYPMAGDLRTDVSELAPIDPRLHTFVEIRLPHEYERILCFTRTYDHTEPDYFRVETSWVAPPPLQSQ